MIQIGESQVRSLAKEMNLREWESVREKTKRVSEKSEGYGAIDAWLEIFEMLGAKEKDLDRLKASDLFTHILDFNKDEIEKKFVRTIELSGRTYEAYPEGGEFVLKGKTMATIERLVKANGDVNFAQVLAAIFEDTQETKAQHYDEDHVEEKAEYFGDMRADIALPYLAEFGVEISGVLKIKEDNGIADGLESNPA